MQENKNHHIIFSSEEDSCFCYEYYNPFEEELREVPDQQVTGKKYPLEYILQKAEYFLLNESISSDNNESFVLAMMVVVDKEGKSRCGILLKGYDDSYSRKVFELLKSEEYLPAKMRNRTINSHYNFLFRL